MTDSSGELLPMPDRDHASDLKQDLIEELRGEGDYFAEGVIPWPTGISNPALASQLFDAYLGKRRDEASSVGPPRHQSAGPADSLAPIFRQHSVLRSLEPGSAPSGSLLTLPVTGDELFGFRLRQELGRGAFARVFLAEQADLGGRPVVLKVSSIDGNEPQTLALLQHTHIVPIHSVHEEIRTGLRAVCMPYFGGASLSRVLQVCWTEVGTPTHGEQLVRALRICQAGTPEPPTLARAGAATALSVLAEMSYVRAAIWIVARLAEGLAHAHERGVLHRDVKPSNILLGADGVPMLLDFNLSRSRMDDPVEAALGGTVAYMAPEHLRALAGRHPTLARQVDHRADLYSLGMVLYELLTGQGPFEQSGSYTLLPQQIEALAVERSRGVPSLRARRPDVPWALESVIRTCLAPAPDDRYSNAGQLAIDLQAWLDDRPLRYAPELSWRERAQKWVRRNPTLTSAGSIACLAGVVLLAALTTVLSLRSDVFSLRTDLTVATVRERKADYEAGTVRALCLLNTVSDLDDPDHLRRGIAECQAALSRFDLLDADGWQEPPAWAVFTEGERRSLAEDSRELLLLLASARVRMTPGDAAVREALALVDRAAAIDGLSPSPALWHDQSSYLALLGDSRGAEAARERGEKVVPVTARDHYMLASALVRKARKGDRRHALDRALRELDTAVRKQPRHYWSWLQRGICHLERGDHLLAASDFGVCIGLWPELAWGHYNRGTALDRAGKKDEAVADYTAALACDNDFLLAYLNRGLARLERKQFAAALEDLTRAAELGRDDAFLHAGIGMAHEGLGHPALADPAFDRAFRRIDAAPLLIQARTRVSYGFAVARRRPEQAEAAFRAVVDRSPTHGPMDPTLGLSVGQALYGLAMLRVEQAGGNGEAIRLFTRALEIAPGFTDARRVRAVLQAREENFAEAVRDINGCLEREPESGPTLYAAACVSARVCEKAAAPAQAREAGDQALAMLRRAFDRGYGRDRAAADPDLAAVRDRPDFDALVHGRTGHPPTRGE
ncbi:MAG: protein kinase [Gemmataceae bacterium]